MTIESGTAVGIDFGGTSVKTGVVVDGRIVARRAPVDTQGFTSSEGLIEVLLGEVAAYREEFPAVAGVGVGLPGFVDSERGVVHHLTNVAGWDEVPLTRILSERTGLRSIIENDANAMAYAEWRYGAAKGSRFAVCITLGTGVGGGLVLDGKIHRGAQFAAGEVGHMSVDYRGKAGPYGNFGGLEEYVGNQQITERAIAHYRENGCTRTPEECSPAELSRLANEGDIIAADIWRTVGDEVGAALANVVWLLNPDAIVIGGGVAKAGDVLFKPIIESVRSRTMSLFHRDLRIVPAALGNDAGIIGNAALALG